MPTFTIRNSKMNKLCQLARAGNYNEIEQLLFEAGKTIDFCESQSEKFAINCVSILANEGKTETVDFLINTLGASREWAMFGYASGGHDAEVTKLIDDGINSKWAARGYAVAGNESKVAALIVKNKVNRDWALGGYASGGHQAQVNALLRQGAKSRTAIYYYASANYVTKVQELLNTELLTPFDDDYYEYNMTAIRGYASGGYQQSAISHEVDVKKASRHNGRDAALWGYSLGGFSEQVGGLIYQGIDKGIAIEGYASQGFIKLTNELIEIAAVKKNYLSYRINDAVKGYFSNDTYKNYNNALRLLVQTPNPKLKAALLKKMKKIPHDIEKLTADSDQISQNMQNNNLTFSQAFSCQVGYVRAFADNGDNNVLPPVLQDIVLGYLDASEISPENNKTLLDLNVENLREQKINNVKEICGNYQSHLQSVYFQKDNPLLTAKTDFLLTIMTLLNDKTKVNSAKLSELKELITDEKITLLKQNRHFISKLFNKENKGATLITKLQALLENVTPSVTARPDQK
jgi:hypothetical protein